MRRVKGSAEAVAVVGVWVVMSSEGGPMGFVSARVRVGAVGPVG